MNSKDQQSFNARGYVALALKMASASKEGVGDAQVDEVETIRCTPADEDTVTCLLPDGSQRSIGKNIIDRSTLLQELLIVTASGLGFEIPAREGRPWLTCVTMPADKLQFVDDAQLIEFLKVRRDIVPPSTPFRLG